MNYSMYVDDIRNPKNEFDIIVRSSKEAINYILKNGCPTYVSLDHDLGGNDTAMNIVKFIVKIDLDSNNIFIPKGFKFNVHSANPIGTANIKGYLNSYLNQRIINESTKKKQNYLNQVYK